MTKLLDEAASAFAFCGPVKDAAPYGSGHINDTYLVTCDCGEGTRRYVLQRMNDHIFKDPDALMENVASVTKYLRAQVVQRGGDPNREALYLIPTVDGGNYYRDSDGHCWRAYQFIEGAVSRDAVETPREFYQSALAFGRFQQLLADYPAETLHETIPDFHNTVKRFDNFRKAVEADSEGRVKNASAEIAFVMERENDSSLLLNLLKAGKLPLRVTHNDTKLNNVMLNRDTGDELCVVDLDTVMPGLAAYDFGDSIRFGASTGAEDERDLSKVEMSLELFELYLKGFIEGCGGSLTPLELETLPLGAKLMTYECGMRFLTDYLQGDTYFKIHREGHNLDRCRTQFKLVADMEKKWEQMAAIVRKYI